MAQSISLLGLYQLENLRRQQTRFILIALTDDASEIPVHSLLKTDFVFAPSEALSKILAVVSEQQMPAWWPIVLISKDGAPDERIAEELAKHAVINVFGYRGGWDAFLAET